MIPSIETIVEGLIDGNFTKSEAITWLHMHANDANRDLRDEFAMAAMQGALTTAAGPCLLGVNGCESAVAEAAYILADAMLEARK